MCRVDWFGVFARAHVAGFGNAATCLRAGKQCNVRQLQEHHVCLVVHARVGLCTPVHRYAEPRHTTAMVWVRLCAHRLQSYGA